MYDTLKAWREAANLNVTEAAAAAQVTPAMWSRWENNRRRIPAERVIDLETLTGVPRHRQRPDLYPAPRETADVAA